MMTFEKMIAAIEALDNDAFYDVVDKEINVTLNDFAGFDEDYCEIMRDYDNEQAVENFLKMLANECISFKDNFYKDYKFNGFTVSLGYASFDI